MINHRSAKQLSFWMQRLFSVRGHVDDTQSEFYNETFCLRTLKFRCVFSLSMPPDDFSFNQSFKVSCFIKRSVTPLVISLLPKRRTASDKQLSLFLLRFNIRPLTEENQITSSSSSSLHVSSMLTLFSLQHWGRRKKIII